jgi:hypothetical protein
MGFGSSSSDISFSSSLFDSLLSSTSGFFLRMPFKTADLATPLDDESGIANLFFNPPPSLRPPPTTANGFFFISYSGFSSFLDLMAGFLVIYYLGLASGSFFF